MTDGYFVKECDCIYIFYENRTIKYTENGEIKELYKLTNDEIESITLMHPSDINVYFDESTNYYLVPTSIISINLVNADNFNDKIRKHCFYYKKAHTSEYKFEDYKKFISKYFDLDIFFNYLLDTKYSEIQFSDGKLTREYDKYIFTERPKETIIEKF